MDNKTNPYLAPQGNSFISTQTNEQNTREATNAPHSSGIPVTMRLARVFASCYIPSLVVAIAVVATWIFLLIIATPPRLRRSGPDFLELIFIFATTLPNVLTCLAFSCCYCTLRRQTQKPTVWPAIVFGILSGLTFNGITTIAVIEHFFSW